MRRVVFELEISLINFASNLMFLILPLLNSNSGSATGVGERKVEKKHHYAAPLHKQEKITPPKKF